jgi:GrxC family glutaredoxin
MTMIEIFTTTSCPYCRNAKDFFNDRNIEFKEFIIDLDEKSHELMKKRAPGAKTVPQIFINGELIGGYDDLMALNDEGELEILLTA